MRPKTWIDTEEKYLIDHCESQSVQEIALHIGKTVGSVKSKLYGLKSVGRIVDKRFTGWPTTLFGRDGVRFIRSHFPKYGGHYCAEKIGFPARKIMQAASFLGIKRKRTKPKIQYEFRSELLTNPTKEFAYFLGYMWADGHVVKSRPIVALDCAFDDLVQIVPILEKLGTWYTQKRVRPNPKLKAQMCIRHFDHSLYNFLCGCGYLSKSGGSPSIVLSLLPAHLRKYWWRGYLDGDGHVTFEHNEYWSMKTCVVSFTSCISQDWEFIYDLFREIELSQYELKKVKDKRGAGSSIVIRHQAECERLLDYIYSDYDYIGLGRKYYPYSLLKKYMNHKRKNPFLYNRSKEGLC